MQGVNLHYVLRAVRKFFVEAVQEVQHKVAWPSYDKVQSSARAVLAAMVCFALLSGWMDWMVREVLAWLYR